MTSRQGGGNDAVKPFQLTAHDNSVAPCERQIDRNIHLQSHTVLCVMMWNAFGIGVLSLFASFGAADDTRQILFLPSR